MFATNRFEDISPLLFKVPTVQEEHHPFVEPSLFYDPPYERPLEDEFAWHLVKYLEPITGLQYQVKVATPCANLWVDFVVEHGARRIGIEIGMLDEEIDEQQEHYRDALLIGSGALDVLYRFRGADLLYRPHDALCLAARWDHDLFTDRARINLNTLASPEARTCHPRPHDTVQQLTYKSSTDDAYEGEVFNWPEDVPSTLVVRRLSRANPSAWMRDYDAALQHFGISDDQVHTQWAKSA